ncbi:hypothetical protein [Methylocaldum szegediense]|jgi:hypothetical protein|uniref:Uncharacterized protein n=1 Tax=Methylocaldum szegediense TaxID=73780 RepID=A0ABN8X1Y9_9GAMM|nr:hypothetical protein [Methylocaldum szegediense]CAI8823916.1 protein of unknown function [Methylocaldum szegediense]CAI8968420.1 protein of unknown function [Methylocaldum szegediense]
MKSNDAFSPKQRLLLYRLAEGMSQAEAARQSDFHPTAVCRFLQKPEAKAELERLMAVAEQRLIERLPALVDKALDVLEAALTARLNPNRQLRAARIVLETASRLVRKANSDGGTIINQPPEPPTDSH